MKKSLLPYCMVLVLAWILGGCQVVKNGAGIDKSVGQRERAKTIVLNLKSFKADDPNHAKIQQAIQEYDSIASDTNTWLTELSSRLDTAGEITVPASDYDAYIVRVDKLSADYAAIGGNTQSAGKNTDAIKQGLELVLWFLDSQKTAAVGKAKDILTNARWMLSTDPKLK